MTRPRIVFAGSPEFAALILRELIAHADLTAVLTQPDRRAGRGLQHSASEVKKTAVAAGLPVWQPSTLGDAETESRLAALAPDFLVTAAYGLMIPQALLDIPAVAALNVHPSLLPRWRGAAPIQRALLAGDQETGVSIMRMVAALDAGPVLAMRRCAIEPRDNSGTLRDRLARLGSECLLATLDAMLHGKARETPQDGAQASYAPKLSAAERRIDWRQSAAHIERVVRAFAPSPGAYGSLRGTDHKILAAEIAGGAGTPGSILAASPDGIDVATGAGCLRITCLQAPGKRAMSAAEFLRGKRAW